MTTLAFAISQRSCYSQWAGHLQDHGPYAVASSMVAETRGALDSDWRVLVVDASSPLLSLTADCHRAYRGVVAVVDPDDPSEKDKALKADVDGMVETGATASEFIRVVTAVLRDLPDTRPARSRPRVTAPSTKAATKRTGAQRIVVGGPPGSDPETVALGLAAACSKRGELVLVVDANDTCPSVAQRLSLPLLPNLISAVDALRSEFPLDVSLLHDAGGFWVLNGCEPSRWPDVRGTAVTVVQSYATGCQRVIVIVGPVLDDLGRWGADRYGTSRSLLADADVIVTVGVANPVGLSRLTTWAVEARSVAPETPMHAVYTQTPRDRYRRGLLADYDLLPADHNLLPLVSVTAFPSENRKSARATWDRTIVHGGRGKTTKALTRLASTVAPRKRKL